MNIVATGALLLFIHISHLSGLPTTKRNSTVDTLDQQEEYIPIWEGWGFDKKKLVLEGQKVNISCPYHSHQQPQSIRWFHGNNEISNGSRGDRRKTVHRNGQLHIRRVQKSDRGTYRCQVHFTDDTVELKNVKIGIKEKPTIVEPTADHVEKKFIVGDFVHLHCHGTGKPEPRVLWLKNGKKLDMDRCQRCDKSRNLLTIVDVQREDAGIYTCQIQNRYGSAEATTVLTVQEPALERPHILYITPAVTTTEGSNVTLNCVASNDHYTTDIRWEINHTNFPWITHSESSVDRNQHNVTSRLILRNLQPTSHTPIQCIARNRIGNKTAQVELSVRAASST